MLAETEADATSSNRHAVHTSHSLHWPQNHELAQLSIPDLLGVVAHNALVVIPAERCVVFMYDKSTNLLSAQVSCSVGDSADQPNEEDDELSFPPVMGMISACFLQRRCLRMQQPHLHKAFHREYDVPNDMAMDSIIAAPVTLHHRTVGVIQLLNRVDPDGPACSPPEPSFEESMTHQPNEKQATTDEDNEVKLMRTKTVAQHARIGFSAKDEQKMIQFTSHVAQLLDNKLKLLAQVESAAKLREEQAKSAMELLEMMNQKLELKPTSIPAEPLAQPRRPSVPVRIATAAPSLLLEDFPLQIEDDQPAIELPAVDLFCGVDMIKVMVGISRTQAIFRGNHLRKVHRLSEALHEHRIARKRVRSALVIQRATRRFLSRKWRKQRRNAVWTIVRAIKSYKARAALAERIAIKRRQKRNKSVVVVVKPREGAHRTLVVDVQRFRQRHDSAVRIQQHFRGHQVRKEVEKVVGFRNFSKGLKNIVKLQSLLRGTIARKKVERIREEKCAARAANVVCMRLASTESLNLADAVRLSPEPHRVLNSRDCVYPLPSSPTGVYVVASRTTEPPSSREECWADLHATQLHLRTSVPTPTHAPRRRRLVQPGPLEPTPDFSLQSMLRPLSRPLAASPVASPRVFVERGPPVLPNQAQVSRVELARQFPSVVFEVDPKRAKRRPPGVQHADDWLPKRSRHRNSTRRDLMNEPPCSQNQTNQLPELPHRSPALQVCFLPAGNPRRRSVAPADIAKAAQAQTPVLPPATCARRPHTTR